MTVEWVLGIWIALTYGISAVFYWGYFVHKRLTWGQWATRLLLGGMVLHTVLLGVRTLASRHLPFANLPESIFFCVWLFALAYLSIEHRLKEKSLGPFILTMVFVVVLVLLWRMPKTSPLPGILRTYLFGIHVSAALLGYAFFALSFVSSLTYTLLFHEIHSKRLRFFYARLPSLETLDHLSRQAVLAGFLALTVAIAVGAFWAFRAWGSLYDPKYVAAVATWLLYAAHVHTHSSRGWRGLKSAYLSIFGFVCVVVVYTVFNMLFTKVHAW